MSFWRGYEITDYHLPADIYVFQHLFSNRRSWQKMQIFCPVILETKPPAKIIVIGCYAQLKSRSKYHKFPVSIVLGTAEKFQLVEVLNKLSESTSGLMEVGPVHHANNFVPSYSLESRTQNFLKVQDGCDYKCSFCTIPQARGKSSCRGLFLNSFNWPTPSPYRCQRDCADRSKHWRFW